MILENSFVAIDKHNKFLVIYFGIINFFFDKTIITIIKFS